MTRTELLEAQHGEASQQCADCRSLAPADAPYCIACGGKLRARSHSRVAAYAIAMFMAIGAVLLYWIVK